METPSFREVAWPRIRNLVTDLMQVSSTVHAAHGMMEVDVSRPLSLISTYKAQIEGGVSLTAYLVYCLAHAVDQHKMLHAYRKGGKKLIIFDAVDVNTLLEKQKPDGTMIPVIYIVRAANHKTLAQINHEMRQASQGSLLNDSGVKRRAQIVKLPALLRRLIWWWTLADPSRIQKYYGTVGLSNVGSFVSARPSWGIGMSFMTCIMIVGGIFDKVYWINGGVEPRKTMTLTVSVNHDIVDGGPGARFGETLAQLIENADSLNDAFLEEAQRLDGTATKSTQESIQNNEGNHDKLNDRANDAERQHELHHAT